MTWSGPLVANPSDRPTRSVCLKLPPPDLVDGSAATFGEVLVVDGGADVPALVSGDVKVLRAHAAAVLAAVEWIETHRRGDG